MDTMSLVIQDHADTMTAKDEGVELVWYVVPMPATAVASPVVHHPVAA